jgi:hypothetical protein
MKSSKPSSLQNKIVIEIKNKTGLEVTCNKIEVAYITTPKIYFTFFICNTKRVIQLILDSALFFSNEWDINIGTENFVTELLKDIQGNEMLQEKALYKEYLIAKRFAK